MPLPLAAAIPYLLSAAPFLVDLIRSIASKPDEEGLGQVAQIREQLVGKLSGAGMQRPEAESLVDQLLSHAGGVGGGGGSGMEMIGDIGGMLGGAALLRHGMKGAKMKAPGDSTAGKSTAAAAASAGSVPHANITDAPKALRGMVEDNRFTRTMAKEQGGIDDFDASLAGMNSPWRSGIPGASTQLRSGIPGASSGIPGSSSPYKAPLIPEVLPPQRGPTTPPNAGGMREYTASTDRFQDMGGGFGGYLPAPQGPAPRSAPPNMAGMRESIVPTDQFMDMGGGELQPDIDLMTQIAMRRLGIRGSPARQRLPAPGE